jgi:hypothetical protein
MSNNYEDAAKRDLESREYQNADTPENTSTTNHAEETAQPKITSLGKAQMFEGRDNDEPALLPGYIEIWPEKFPSKGLFYPQGIRFFIRSAQVKEIRHFSTINEQDPFTIDEALNEILKSCLMIRMPNRQMSFKDLKEEDRIHIIMAVRELTFPKGENQLVLKVPCKECNHENEIKVINDTFEHNEVDEKMMKYYNEETRRFEVQTKSNGTIIMSPPSIGTMMEITKYIQKKQQEGKKLDQSFIKVLPYLESDWRGFNDSRINNLEIEFMAWDTTKYNTMYALTDMCRVGVKENLHAHCEKCHSEVTTPISFPGGIKSLFVVSDLAGELL